MINRQDEVQLSDYIPLCHVIVDGSISRRTNLLISSSVNVPGSVLFIPSLYGKKKKVFKKAIKWLFCFKGYNCSHFPHPPYTSIWERSNSEPKLLKKAHTKVPITKTEALLMEE